MFKYLESRDVDEVGYTLRTASPMTNPEYYFDDRDLSDYRLFGIHYIITPAGSRPHVPARLELQAGPTSNRSPGRGTPHSHGNRRARASPLFLSQRPTGDAQRLVPGLVASTLADGVGLGPLFRRGRLDVFTSSSTPECATGGKLGSLRPTQTDIFRRVRECSMPYTVDFNTVSTVGLESSPVAAALAGLRANEARYFKNKYDHVFVVEPASNAKTTIDWVHQILKEERDIVISSRPLEATAFKVENIRIAYVFYESGLSINVMYTVDDPGKRAVGFKLSDGMEVPAELASRFKFARQKSKLAGTIRGSYFAFKNDY